MNKLLLALLLTLSVNAFADDVTYVGGGRYSCSGSDCERFNAIKNSGRYENVNPSGSTPLNDSTRDFIEEQDRKREMERYRGQLRSESDARERERVAKERGNRPITKEEAEANLKKIDSFFEDQLRQSEEALKRRK